jgi:aryl-alcohol dehydrogenase-like predicted oxidoreductase
LRESARSVAALCRRRGADVAQVALQFAVQPSQFATTVVGSETVAKVSRNVGWIAQPLDESLVREIETLVGPLLNTPWRTSPPLR